VEKFKPIERQVGATQTKGGAVGIAAKIQADIDQTLAGIEHIRKDLERNIQNDVEGIDLENCRSHQTAYRPPNLHTSILDAFQELRHTETEPARGEVLGQPAVGTNVPLRTTVSTNLPVRSVSNNLPLKTTKTTIPAVHADDNCYKYTSKIIKTTTTVDGVLKEESEVVEKENVDGQLICKKKHTTQNPDGTKTVRIEEDVDDGLGLVKRNTKVLKQDEEGRVFSLLNQ